MKKSFGFVQLAMAGGIWISSLGGIALAQDATSGALSANPELKGWIKICDEDAESQKQVCALSFQIIGDNEQPVASLRIVEVEGAASKAFTILVPPGMLLQPGLRVQVDSSKQNAVPFQICFPNACIAEARVDDAFVSGLKRGNELKLTGLNQQGKPIDFSATLAGFTATYDGPGLPPEQARAATETLQQKLQRRAEEARKKLLEQNNESQ